MTLIERQKVRALFISDVHLGSEHCNYSALLNVIKDIECEYIYLVGDFIDGWLLRKNFRWKQEYNTIIQKLLKQARHGTKIIYVWGNHDDFLNSFNGTFLGENIKICRSTEHVTLRGKRLCIIHGDVFDGLLTKYKWIQKAGAIFYELSLKMNKFFRLFKFSFSKFLKARAKRAVNYISNYEDAVINHAKRNKCTGIITGHIHKANLYTKDGILYGNCGDFIESNTYIVEDVSGEIKLLEI